MAMSFRNLVGQTLLLAGLGAICATLACSGGSSQNPQASAPGGMPVKVREAKAVPVNDTAEYVATLKSRDSAVLMPQVEGQVTRIYVHSGERVAAGAALMEIDPLKQQATVRSQESTKAAQLANLNWTQQQYERAQGLFSARVAAKPHLDQAEAARGSPPAPSEP